MIDTTHTVGRARLHSLAIPLRFAHRGSREAYLGIMPDDRPLTSFLRKLDRRMSRMSVQDKLSMSARIGVVSREVLAALTYARRGTPERSARSGLYIAAGPHTMVPIGHFISLGHGVCVEFGALSHLGAAHLGVPTYYVRGNYVHAQRDREPHIWLESSRHDRQGFAIETTTGRIIDKKSNEYEQHYRVINHSLHAIPLNP